MNGARALLESLKAEGVEVVFGYPGGAVLTLYDEVYKMKLYMFSIYLSIIIHYQLCNSVSIIDIWHVMYNSDHFKKFHF